MRGMDGNVAHSALFDVADDAIDVFGGDDFVMAMAESDKHVGVREQFLGKSLARVLEARGGGADIFLFIEHLGDGAVDTVGVDFGGFGALAPDQDANGGFGGQGEGGESEKSGAACEHAEVTV